MKDIIIYKNNIDDDKLDICKYIWKYDKPNNNIEYKCILCERNFKILLYTFLDKTINTYIPYCGYSCAINNIQITEIRLFFETNINYINKINKTESKTKIIYIK